MKIEDPILFQERLDEINEKDKKIETVWQKGLDSEPDYNKRKMICFEMLDRIGIDTTNWTERLKTERELRDG